MSKRQKGRMARKVDNQRNIPVPWKPRKWSSSADVGRLPSVATSILQGPDKTQFGSIIGWVPRTFAIVENGIRGFQSRKLFTQTRRSILSQGPFGIVKGFLESIGV